MAKQRTYKDKKEWVRSQAIEWQFCVSEHNFHYSVIQEMTEIFTRLGKQYGLLKEFRENGII